MPEINMNQAIGFLGAYILALLAILPVSLVVLFGSWTQVINPVVGDLVLLAEFAGLIIAGAVLGGLAGGFKGKNNTRHGIYVGILAALVAFGFWVIGDLYFGIATIAIDYASPVVDFLMIFVGVASFFVACVIYKIGDWALE